MADVPILHNGSSLRKFRLRRGANVGNAERRGVWAGRTSWRLAMETRRHPCAAALRPMHRDAVESRFPPHLSI
jgi:hypothetical protein